jgi:hypothetical protein
MRIAICDDKSDQIEVISSSTKAYFASKHREDYDISSFFEVL